MAFIIVEVNNNCGVHSNWSKTEKVGPFDDGNHAAAWLQQNYFTFSRRGWEKGPYDPSPGEWTWSAEVTADNDPRLQKLNQGRN